jgi:DNA polymerase-3 subunit delta'
MTAARQVPETIRDATVDQPAARVALSAAVADPFHAYLLAGPRGSGKGAAARALAAELLAEGAGDPAGSRRRVLADPSPHPDLVWLRPPGNQHLVETVREQVIAQVAYRPFEGDRRVFVVEAAEAMAEESQNALLKTLEEPPAFAHLILVSAEPEGLLETVRSRCRAVRFARLGPEAVEARLGERAEAEERRAAARLSGGDVGRASFLLDEQGRDLRAAVELLARAVRSGELGDVPWEALARSADAAGERESAAIRARAADAEQDAAERSGPAARRRARDAEDAAKRGARRERNATLDLGLALFGAWMRDLAAVAERAPELVLNSDRSAEVAELAEGLDPRRARRAGELVMETRRRLQVNVSEALALEALAFRVEYLLARH